jgi:hypothetical protein
MATRGYSYAKPVAMRGYNREIVAKFGYGIKIAVFGHDWEANVFLMCMHALSTCNKRKR